MCVEPVNRLAITRCLTCQKEEENKLNCINCKESVEFKKEPVTIVLSPLYEPGENNGNNEQFQHVKKGDIILF